MNASQRQHLRSLLQETGVDVYLCGTHSTGKSTLAGNLSAALGLPQAKSSTRSVLSRHHTTAAYVGKTQGEIAVIQEEIMDTLLDNLLLRPVAPSHVVDRAPIDVLAYSLARLARSAEREDDIFARVLREQRSIVKGFPSTHRGIYLLCPPNIDASFDSIREPLPFYRDLVHYVIHSLLTEYGYVFHTVQSNQELARIDECCEAIRAMLGMVPREQ